MQAAHLPGHSAAPRLTGYAQLAKRGRHDCDYGLFCEVFVPVSKDVRRSRYRCFKWFRRRTSNV